MNEFLATFTSPAAWVSIVTLTFMEIILGIDNIIFISLVSDKLPKSQQKRARSLGLLIAMGIRIVLLFGIKLILQLQEPIANFTLLAHEFHLSGKDLILIGGGIFLIYKTVQEILEKLEDSAHKEHNKHVKSFFSTIIEICIINLVFSVDTIITAIGLTKDIYVMMGGVIFSILIIMQFSGVVSEFINKHPSLQMLALSFLLLIGAVLILEGVHVEVSKDLVYFSIFFSLAVEMLNMKLRKNLLERDGKKMKI